VDDRDDEYAGGFVLEPVWELKAYTDFHDETDLRTGKSKSNRNAESLLLATLTAGWRRKTNNCKKSLMGRSWTDSLAGQKMRGRTIVIAMVGIYLAV